MGAFAGVAGFLVNSILNKSKGRFEQLKAEKELNEAKLKVLKEVSKVEKDNGGLAGVMKAGESTAEKKKKEEEEKKKQKKKEEGEVTSPFVATVLKGDEVKTAQNEVGVTDVDSNDDALNDESKIVKEGEDKAIKAMPQMTRRWLLRPLPRQRVAAAAA